MSVTPASWKTMLGPKIMPPGAAPAYTVCDIKTVTPDERNLYLPLIRPYKIWDSHFLRMGDEVAVYARPGEPPKMMKVDEYNGTDRKAYSCLRISNSPVTSADYTSGYLYRLDDADFKDDVAQYDAIDRTFIDGKDGADGEGSRVKKLVFYGLHTYGGYHGFFRPDLAEVISLFAPFIPPTALSDLEAIYVTTQMHPSDNVGACYDQHEDRHRGMTTVYLISRPFTLSVLATIPTSAPTSN